MSGSRFELLTLQRTDDTISASVLVPDTTILTAGHFPGDLLLPGVAQLSILHAILIRGFARSVTISTVESWRLRGKIALGEPVDISLERRPDGHVAFSLIQAGALISSGLLQLSEP